MSNTAQPRQRETLAPTALVYSLFFLSGVAALVYEVAWSRLVGIVLGNTAQAASLVLAAFFSGLALGQWLGGTLARRGSPLLGYGLAELAAALGACLVSPALDWIGNPAVAGDPSFADSSRRALGCFLILLPATIPLGASLPLAIESLSADRFRTRGPLAYGLNTAGGLLGVSSSAFLLVAVGVAASALLAAGLSAACGVVACGAAFVWRGRNASTTPPSAEGESGGRTWLVVAAVSGFGTLGLEILSTRLFALVFHNSTYTFAAVVAVFLLGLSLGAALASWLGGRLPSRTIAATSFALGGVVVATSAAAFPRLTGLHYFTFGDTFAGYLTGAFALVAVFLLPPVVLLGMALPAAFQHAHSSTIGRLSAVNTLAAVSGSLVAGFVLPPLAGLWLSFALFAGLFCLMGVGLLLLEKRFAFAVLVAIVGVAVAFVPSTPTAYPDADIELVRRWESSSGWIDVVRARRDGSLAIRQNLHYQHGSTATPFRSYRQGRLPLLLHSRPKEVAFLGLGTGLTATPAIVDRRVERAVVVELIPEVIEASRLLEEANLGIADHPRVEVKVDDGRHFLLRTPRRFDVIVCDLFVPWESRAGYLYTVEFYRTARRRLRPGGLFCQWVALYQVGPEQWESIADSFTSVFPNATLWWGQLDRRYPTVALIGSEAPLVLDPLSLAERLDAQGDLPGGADPDLRLAADVPALYLGTWPRNSSRRRNTDEQPWLEFTAPLSHRGGRTLQGAALRRYFDEVLSRLPSGGVEPGEPIRDSERRRASQRLSLFGETP